jgi:ribose 5-phosphate isomerase B
MSRQWFAGADHAGVHLKNHLCAFLRELGDEVVDLGVPDDTQKADYPDYAHKVCAEVVATPGALGLLVCGSGTGISIAANKVRGIRAVRATEGWSARMAREHNDCNVVCLGERVTGSGLGEDIVRAFRDGVYAAGRHAGRIAKLE